MKQYPPYSEGTAETMSKIDWDLDYLQLQIDKLDSIDSDVQSGVLEANLAKAYEHLKVLECLLKDLDDDNVLWLQKHEEDLDERFVHCSPRLRAIIVELSPSLPTRKRADLMHQTIREQINRGSRPGPGSIKVTDMPNEILSRISTFVLDDSLPDREYTRDKYVKYIKCLRLTCWRFHNACSCLLVETLSVDMTPISLSRLNLFSRHPTINKGIHTIRVFLDYYDSVMAKDIQVFAIYHATHFNYLTHKVDNIAYNTNIWGVPVETLYEAVKKGLDYVQEWTAFSRGLVHGDTPYLNILREAHKKYQAEYEIQKRLREGDFLTDVAAAFARMKMVETLEIRDDRSENWDNSDQMYERKGRLRYWEVVYDHDAMVESMVFPTKWEHTRRLEHPCIDQLVKLPTAIHQGGGCLTTIDIYVSGPRDLALFATEKHHLEELRNSIQSLKTFSFILGDDRDGTSVDNWSSRRADEFLHMRNFLTHILDTSSLESLTLDLSFLWDNNDLKRTRNLLSILDIRVLQKWERISHLNLTFLPVRIQDIEALTKYVIKPRVRVDFNAILLLNGDWGVVLDILRKKTGPHTKFYDLRLKNSDNLWVDMHKAPREGSCSEDEGDKRALPGTIYCTKAEAYLRGLIDYNPLRGQEPIQESADSGSEGGSP